MGISWSQGRDRAIAVLSSLHLGIEPALLALLVAGGAVPVAACGWVVGAGQLGASAGAFLCWRAGGTAGRGATVGVALVGTAASLALAVAPDLPAVLLLRLVLGGALGFCFARATASAARARPRRAIGTIVLGQQLLATATMTLLAGAAARLGPGTALAALGAVPALVAALALAAPSAGVAGPEAARASLAASARAPATLAPMMLLLALTMMVWSYLDAVGAALSLPGPAADRAVAAASLTGAPAALAATLCAPRLERWITAALCGAAMLAPLLLPPGAGLIGYVAAMALFNAGAAVAAVRFCAWAMEGAGCRDRRLAALAQCVALTLGPPGGALMVALGGLPLLAGAAAACALAAAVAILAGRPAGRELAARPLVAG